MPVAKDGRLDPVNEGGSKKLKFEFFDENGTAITPKTISWWLHDSDYNVVNSRDTVSGTVDSTFRIRLQGNDIDLDDNPDRRRVITLKYTYDSDDWGSDTEEVYQWDFTIDDQGAI